MNDVPRIPADGRRPVRRALCGRASYADVIHHSSIGSVLTAPLAVKFCSLALAHVEREYPSKLDHVLSGDQDVRGPRELHPVFYGSFDWHSCVHGYWLLARLYRRFPADVPADRVREVIGRNLTEYNVGVELAYLTDPGHAGFERPYGWAWLLMLAAELARHETPEGRLWRAALAPLADEIVIAFRRYLRKAEYPVRSGTHSSTAFAIALGLEYAGVVGDESFAELLRGKAREWYGGDEDARVWEPGGDDFLSATLMEVECMRRALPAQQFAPWLGRFLPRLAEQEPTALFTPARVSDRSDGKIAHLDGLNLSRAWCWGSLAQLWPGGDPRREAALSAASRHLAVSLPWVAGEYAGEHWLATFALLALEAVAEAQLPSRGHDHFMRSRHGRRGGGGECVGERE
ncbi:MAG: DUF2891 domain-containing protein [Gemmatimonadetes bacterium]|nr:DUF2891 domain-containing protein [Gemmatimonadota bacterium]